MKSSSCLGLTYKFYFWLILTDYSSPLLTFGRKGENLSMCTSMATFYSYLLVFHCLSLVHGQLQMEINRDSSLLIDDSFKLPRNTTECLVIKDIPSPSCFKYLASPLRQRRTPCWCSCSVPLGEVQSRYTSLFFEPSNSCLDVSLARRRSGNITCLRYRFQSDTTTTILGVL